MKHRQVWIFSLVLCLASGCTRIADPKPIENIDECPDNPNKTKPGVCGCDVDDVIDALTGIYQCMVPEIDLCPNDPNKTSPGVCGCNVADTLNSNGIPLCLVQNVDFCPDDPNKTLPGICGCGVEDTLGPAGVADCLSEQMDLCPDDPEKKLPGVCGCGVSDEPDTETGAPSCLTDTIDFCPLDDNKMRPGVCDCGTPDIDTDGDTILDCKEQCPEDTEKVEPGMCGCGIPDSDENISDADSDGVINCLDACPQNPWKSEDDDCSCEQLFYQLTEFSGCAEIIASAEDFIALRDHWNNGSYDAKTSDTLAYIMVSDINLGDVLTVDTAASWTGIGTEEYPFDAIFVGNGRSFTATKKNGLMTQTLTLGHENADFIGLFGFTREARLESIQSNVSLTGHSHVGGLVALAERTTMHHIQVESTISGMTHAGGIAAEMVNSTLNNAVSNSQILVSENIAGGIVGKMSDSLISNAKTTGHITGGNHVGGIAGIVTKASKLSSVVSTGVITGNAYTGGLIAELSSRSQLLNAYTTSEVVCQAAPCASVLAYIHDFSTVKNIYTTGTLINEIPENPPPSSEDDADKDLENLPENNGNDDPNTENDGNNPNTNPEEGEENSEEDPQNPSVPVFPITAPIATLIASFGSLDNVVDMLYDWEQITEVPIPEITTVQLTVTPPQTFAYVSLRPQISDTSTPLLTELNENLSCNAGTCTLDGTACLPWVVGSHKLNNTTMTVKLPILSIPLVNALNP